MSEKSEESNKNEGANIYSQDEEEPIKIEGIDPIPLANNKFNYVTKSGNKIVQKNEKDKDDFISGLKKIFIFFFQRIDFLLEPNNSVKFPNLKKNDFKSIIEFLTEVNKLSDKQFNYTSEYKIQNSDLKDILRNCLYETPNGKGKISKDSFIANFDDYFEEEKYSPNDKNQNKKSIKNKKISKSNDILLLKYYQIDPILKNFQEFKDYLKIECKFSVKDFDSRGNFIIPNLSNNNYRGTEKYYPPYGYNGIGLQVSEKYEKDGNWLLNKTETSKWANAYLSLFQENNSDKSSTDIKEKIYDLCFKNVKNVKDIYLNYKIENAEKEAALIEVNGKKYKILLMARVKIDEISKPKEKDVWVLDKEFIRIYRILFKKI